MRALHFNGSEARVIAAAEPRPGAGDAIVRVTLAGICNTDLELVRGYMGFTGILGHEFVGVVEHGPADWRGGASSARSTSPAGAATGVRAGSAGIVRRGR
jgi:threonine dehydrogenase-like Zn-dependent dehydrogenase